MDRRVAALLAMTILLALALAQHQHRRTGMGQNMLGFAA